MFVVPEMAVLQRGRPGQSAWLEQEGDGSVDRQASGLGPAEHKQIYCNSSFGTGVWLFGTEWFNLRFSTNNQQ